MAFCVELRFSMTRLGAVIGCRALGCVWIWRKLVHSRDLASSSLSLAHHILANPVAPPDWEHWLHFDLDTRIRTRLDRDTRDTDLDYATS